MNVRSTPLAVIVLVLAASVLRAQDLPVLERRAEARPPTDWLIDPAPYPAKVVRTGRPPEIALEVAVPAGGMTWYVIE
jgi:hypothetical protein